MATPTYTYGFDPTHNEIDQVRLWIQDTILFFNAERNAMTMQFADQEIQSYIDECSSLYEAAASCCESLAAIYAGKHQYTKKIGDIHVSENYQKQHLNYLEIANNIRKRHASYQSFAPAYAPASIQNTEQNEGIPETTDFYTGQFDNLNPVGGADPDVQSLTGF